LTEITLLDELNEKFLLETADKLISEIKQSKTDSKNHHFQRLAYNLMKIGVKGNFPSLIQRGKQDLEPLNTWSKAEGYLQFADFLSEGNYVQYSPGKYYKKSYQYWKDTILNQKEPTINLTGSALNLIKSLKKNNQINLLEQAAIDYVQFLDLIPIEQQPSEWLKFALQMVNLFSEQEVRDLISKAKSISQSEVLRSKQQFSINRWLLKFEIAKKKKNIAGLEELYEELMVNQSSEMDMGIIQQSGMILSKENQMKHIAITFAEAFWEVEAPEKALIALDTRLNGLISKWHLYEKGGWPAGSAQKSLMLKELVALGENYVQHDQKDKCEPLKPILVQNFEVGEEIHPSERINLLVTLGWYSTEALSERVNQVLPRIQAILTQHDFLNKPEQLSPLIMMQISRHTSELYFLKAMAEKMKDEEILEKISQFEEKLNAQALKQKDQDPTIPKTQQIDPKVQEKQLLRQRIHEHLNKKEIEEAKPLVNEYEEFIRKTLSKQPLNTHQYALTSLIDLYLACEDYNSAKQILSEIEEIPTEIVEVKKATNPFLPGDRTQIMQKRHLFQMISYKILIDTKLELLHLEEILNKTPADDPEFLYQIGIVFVRNNALKAAQDILQKTRPPENIQQKVTSSDHHFLRAQIFRKLGATKEALRELEISNRTESEYQGYEITSNLTKYLEEYFLLGERDQAVKIIDKIFTFMSKDSSLRLLRIPIPKCLFKTKYDKLEAPKYFDLQQHLKKFYLDHICTVYQKILKPGKFPRSFHETISYILLLIQLEQINDARELVYIVLKTLELLLKDKIPELFTQKIQQASDLENQPSWEPQILFMKLTQDSITIPSNMNMRDMLTASPLSPLATEKEKQGLYQYKYSTAYQQLSTVFSRLNLPKLAKLCKDNSQVILSALDSSKTMATSITIFSEIESSLTEQKYSVTKSKIQQAIHSLDGTKITSWEQFFPYTRIFKLIAQV